MRLDFAGQPCREVAASTGKCRAAAETIKSYQAQPSSLGAPSTFACVARVRKATIFFSCQLSLIQEQVANRRGHIPRSELDLGRNAIIIFSTNALLLRLQLFLINDANVSKFAKRTIEGVAEYVYQQAFNFCISRIFHRNSRCQQVRENVRNSPTGASHLQLTLIYVQDIICSTAIIIPCIRRGNVKPTLLALIPSEHFATMSI